MKKKNKSLLFIFIKIIIILLFLFSFLILYIKNHNDNKEIEYCYKCIKNSNYINLECWNCTNEILFKNLYIGTKEETVDEIIKYNKSLSRFADGEYIMILGGKMYFQSFDDILAHRLWEIINSHEKKCLIGIYMPYKKEELNLFVSWESNFWIKFLKRRKFDLFKIIKQDKKFYNAGISKFYQVYRDKTKSLEYVKKLKIIWDKRDVIVIEGETGYFGAANDLLDNTKSIRRIVCPSQNAFRFYDKIMEFVLKFDKNNLILLSLGPTATVLSYDLCKLGYQAIDVGHTDYDYESFLRNATKPLFKRDFREIQESKKEKYNKQIIKTFKN